jgi:hypothetical protein
MTRGLGIVAAAFVVALALAPRSADAQVIYACVQSPVGTLIVVAANTNCPPPSGGVTWTKTNDPGCPCRS